MKKRLEQTGLCEEVVLIKKKKKKWDGKARQKAQKIIERRMFRARKQDNNRGQGLLATPPSVHAQPQPNPTGRTLTIRLLVWSQTKPEYLHDLKVSY